MAYRRRQGITRASTFKEEIHHSLDPNHSLSSSSSFTSSSSLAAQAIRASAAHRDSSLSDSAFPFRDSSDPLRSKLADYDDTSTTNASKSGFWGVLARKAKAILDDDNVSPHFETAERTRTQFSDTTSGGQFQQSYQSPESMRKMDNPTLRKGLDALTSSLNHIGDTFEKAFEEGRTIVESKTADIIQETRKMQIRRKGFGPEGQTQALDENNSMQFQNNHQTQLKASRDVAMATAAKAKLLLRELKTVKADLAFAKERCAQLEEENKILRENRQKGENHADDDLIRLQLETLLAEKARLAHENSIYARENRFLREIVEYHQLTMQDVVYLDEGIEEVTEVYPLSAVSRMLSISPPSPGSPRLSSEIEESANLLMTEEILTIPSMPLQVKDDLGGEVRLSSRTSSVHEEECSKGPSVSSV